MGNIAIKLLDKDRFIVRIKLMIKPLGECFTMGIIDTGCDSSCISLGSIIKDDNELNKIKGIFVDNFLKFNGEVVKLRKSKGVNDYSVKTPSKLDIKGMSRDELLNDNSISSYIRISDFSINELNLENISRIRVRFDYCPSLIGMDILKDLTWHYSNGILILGKEDDSSKLYKICKTLLFKSIIKEHKGIDESVESLPKEIDKDTAYRALYEVLQDTYFED